MVKIRDVHRRHVAASPEIVGSLIDGLAAEHDQLWPVQSWPRMRFDIGLKAGGRGGHGPIGYTVERHDPGRAVVFRFTGDAPRGLNGWHWYDVLPDAGGCRIDHVLEGTATGFLRLTWLVIWRPMHDALIEDSLDNAERVATGRPPTRPARWGPWVRLLRRGARRRGLGERTQVPLPVRPGD
jgi:hypothetical protein